MLQLLIDFEACLGPLRDLVDRNAGRKLGECHATALFVDGKDAEVGDDHIHYSGTGEWQFASVKKLRFVLAVCSITMTTFFTPATRSIAPPIPFTIFPGIIQLARSPFSATCIAPRMERSICPPRIIANESAEEKKLVVGSSVTVCLPALIRSGSSSPSRGNGPKPSMPFSLCN